MTFLTEVLPYVSGLTLSDCRRERSDNTKRFLKCTYSCNLTTFCRHFTLLTSSTPLYRLLNGVVGVTVSLWNLSISDKDLLLPKGVSGVDSVDVRNKERERETGGILLS